MKNTVEIISERNEILKTLILRGEDIYNSIKTVTEYIGFAYGKNTLKEIDKFLNGESEKESEILNPDELNEENAPLYEHVRNAYACVEEALTDDGNLREKDKKDRYSQALYDLGEAMKIILKLRIDMKI